MYTLSYYHHQIGSMNYHPFLKLGLGHETMVCAVCLSIFLWGSYMRRGYFCGSASLNVSHEKIQSAETLMMFYDYSLQHFHSVS